ncbi:transposase [Aureispira sp. CCB-E]|uniref:IS110 family transposase n=1 Tax=Aureispira sp. CCB-E TaxID=3051121 RepID=UPI0028696081|nr:transposase [Aureispira sp. CCB-E]WMX14730.1 transposase [Aureispira sp. CCB-E]
MEKLQKQCVGIEISKLTFTVCVCSLGLDQNVYLSEVEEFSNDKKGFNRFVRWSKKQQNQSVEMVYLMEATGVYYESLAYHLHKIKKTVHVVLPNKAKHYIGSLNQKTKTDSADAQALARFGVERKFSEWHPPAPIYKKLKGLCRFRVSLKENRTMLLNQISSIEASEQGDKFIKKSLKELVKKIEVQIKSCEQEILRVLEQDQKIATRVQ